jgi:ABC-type sugar transport system ATPase subunit
VPVLFSVNMDIRAGEIHALIGENGAGKSTLMKILSGFPFPDTGRYQARRHDDRYTFRPTAPPKKSASF